MRAVREKRDALAVEGPTFALFGRSTLSKEIS